MSESRFISSDSNKIKTILDDPDTVFLVFANPSDEEIQPLYDDAEDIIKNNNPSTWRVLWVKNPERLDAELTKLFWSDGVTQAVVLSFGKGLQRVVKKRYARKEITRAFHIMDAFSKG